MGKQSAPSDRAVSQEEKDAYNAQSASLEELGRVAQSQFDLSEEQVNRYTAAFQDPNNLANADLAEFQSLVTGGNVTADSLAGKSLEDIIRETMLQAPASFAKQAETYISTTDKLAKDYNASTQFNTDALTKTLGESGYKYQTQLADTAKKMGTIDTDILSRETGASTAGISSAFAEGQKGLDASLAQRGLSGSGIDASSQIGLAGQEARAKAGGIAQARARARGLSDQLRLQRDQLAQQQYNVAGQTAQGIYGARQQGAGNIYQTSAGQAGSALNAQGQGLSQGLGALGQVQGYGQQQLAGATGLASQAGSLYGQQAGAYGGLASGLTQQSTNTFNQQVAGATQNNAGLGQLVGTIGGATIGGMYGGTAGATLGANIGSTAFKG